MPRACSQGADFLHKTRQQSLLTSRWEKYLIPYLLGYLYVNITVRAPIIGVASCAEITALTGTVRAYTDSRFLFQGHAIIRNWPIFLPSNFMLWSLGQHIGTGTWNAPVSGCLKKYKMRRYPGVTGCYLTVTTKGTTPIDPIHGHVVNNQLGDDQ